MVGGVQARRILAVLPRPGREPGGPGRKRSALGRGGWDVVVQQRRVVVVVVEAAVADVEAPPGRRHVARAVAEGGARLLLPVPVLGRLRGQAGHALRGRHLAPLRAGEGAAAAGPVPIQGALSLERPRSHRVLPLAALALPARLALGRPAGGSGRCRHDGRPAGVLPAPPRFQAFRVPLAFPLSHRASRGAGAQRLRQRADSGLALRRPAPGRAAAGALRVGAGPVVAPRACPLRPRGPEGGAVHLRVHPALAGPLPVRVRAGAGAGVGVPASPARHVLHHHPAAPGAPHPAHGPDRGEFRGRIVRPASSSSSQPQADGIEEGGEALVVGVRRELAGRPRGPGRSVGVGVVAGPLLQTAQAPCAQEENGTVTDCALMTVWRGRAGRNGPGTQLLQPA